MKPTALPWLSTAGLVLAVGAPTLLPAAAQAQTACDAPALPTAGDTPAYDYIPAGSVLPSIGTGLNRVQAQALASAQAVATSPDGTTGPGTSACLSDTFGAPLAAQGLNRARGQLAHAQSHLTQLRWAQPTARKTGLSVYVDGSEQSRREGGSPQAGTQALRVSRVDVNVGADYRHNEHWVAGGAMGLGNPRLRWDGSTSRVDGSSANLTLYGSWSPTPSSYVAAALSTESTHYQLQTHTDAGPTRDFTTGTSTGLSLSAGQDHILGSVTVSPYARWDEVRARVGSFGSAQGANKGRSGSFSLGSQVQTSVPTRWGLVLPHARLEFTRITGWRIRGESATAYAASAGLLPSPDPLALDRQLGQLGIGASALFQGGWSVFTDFDTGFAQQGVSSWRFTLGLRTEL